MGIEYCDKCGEYLGDTVEGGLFKFGKLVTSQHICSNAKKEGKMEHNLEFLNPTYHYGENVTIRKGRKWFDKARVGDTVVIRRTGHLDFICEGIITEVRLVPYSEVFLRDLLEEHDRECGTPFGLTHAMLRAYPDFTLDSEVTVLRFRIPV